MNIAIPELSLVMLIGPSGSGKSTFASRHFGPHETVSSDYCRAVVSNDENSLEATDDAFALLWDIVRKRLARGLLTVVDATNVRAEARALAIEVAREFHVMPVAIVFDLPKAICHERNEGRANRQFAPHVVNNQHREMVHSIRRLRSEGFRYLHVLKSPEQVDAADITRQPMWTNLSAEKGPFDIIGDVHGCLEELVELLRLLGYEVDATLAVTPPAGRRAIFLGDLVDRGPDTPGVLRLVMGMVRARTALCVPGNHDMKFLKALRGENVRIVHGLKDSMEQMSIQSSEFKEEVQAFLKELISHYVLDGGRLVVAHAGMRQEMQGRGSTAVRDFALYGETTGVKDEFGLPIRVQWAMDYRGKAMVVYGHTPVHEPEFLNNTINIDTGCVFGGKLTALRYPEREIVSVPARREYVVSPKPLLPTETDSRSAQQDHDDLLHIGDILGKRIITLDGGKTVTIRPENSAPALEVMSRFAADPRWLITLPPTMAPCATSARDGYLEHPEQAFDEYRDQGVRQVICEEKHMGSRCVVIVCRGEEVAHRRFGLHEPSLGAALSRTGRHFFNTPTLQDEFLLHVRESVSAAGLWEELATDWLCLDCELMPWSSKARALLQEQYAPVASAGRAMLGQAVSQLEAAVGLGLLGAEEKLGDVRSRLSRLELYATAYGRYCWATNGLEGHRLAPFHILASEGHVHTDKSHDWHMALAGRMAQSGASPLLQATRCINVDLEDARSTGDAIEWWEQMTSAGGEGMVVKPREFMVSGPKGLLQPAVKCRGREYLRIIYGPEYDLPDNLDRLRQRGLGRKRSLAMREFQLGIESLRRFVRHEPLRRVHECVFGILALETEPVDPRL